MAKNPGKSKRECEVCGSRYKVSICRPTGQYLCNKHKLQVLRCGKIKRTKFDPNEIILYENYAEICLYNAHGKEVAKSKVSKEDVEKIKKYKWYKTHFDYVETRVYKPNKKRILLHRFILNCPKDKIVDHINGDKLDNRRENLRICSFSENSANRTKFNLNKSGVYGVTKCFNNDGYYVRISKNKECKYLGYCKDLNKAKKIRLKAEKEYFGEFAPSFNKEECR